MKRNLGTIDRWVRLGLAALGWWLAAWIGYATVGGVLVLVAAGILVATAAVGLCPLYALLSISTRGGFHRPAHA
ncbi:MAG TPA: DUF2892 domain-containing protein [Actinomycetes bacterium]|jgi:hypothetical protein|nr:DUF2892 domain-containing protein [Actinomycetes bacterium]